MKLRIVLKVKIAPNRFLQFYAPATYSSLIDILAKQESPQRETRLWYSSGDGNLVLLTSEMYPFVLSTWPFAQLIIVTEPCVPARKVSFHDIGTKVFNRILMVYILATNVGYRLWEWGQDKGKEIRNQCVSAYSRVKESFRSIKPILSRNYQSLSSRFSFKSEAMKGLKLTKRLGFVPMTVLVLLLSYAGLSVAPQAKLSTLRRQFLSSRPDYALELTLSALPEINWTDFTVVEIPDSDAGKVFYGTKETRTGFLFYKGLDRVEFGTFGQGSKLNGIGIRIDDTGETYQGSFLDGFRHGKGCVFDANHNIMYEGDFQKGARHGFGKAITYDTRTQEALRNVTQILWRKGTISLYIGQWISDEYEGNGELQTENYTYVGDFASGSISGYGLMKKEGLIGHGAFHNGLLDGFGCEETSEIVACGQFWKGKCNGKILKSNKKTGEVSSATCANGKERTNWWCGASSIALFSLG